MLVDLFILSNLFITPLLSVEPKGEYSYLILSMMLGLIPRWLSVNNSYLSRSFEDNADIFAFMLSRLY